MSDYQKLLERWGIVSDLGAADRLLDWDEQTFMPHAGADARGQVRGTIVLLRAQYLSSPETLVLLQAAEKEQQGAAAGSDELAILREIRRDYERAVKIPPTLVAQKAQLCSTAHIAWLSAKKANDFSIFQPYLEKIIVIERKRAELFGYEAHPYDALLPDFEPDMSTEELKGTFAELKRRLVAICQHPALQNFTDDTVLQQDFDPDEQLQFSRRMMRHVGLEAKHGRLDTTEHPFMTGIASPFDVRTTMRSTTRFDILSALHECGHALYERGIKPAYFRTPLNEITSMAMHESQSRLLENHIGRSREFWTYWYPRLQERFPVQLESVSLDSYYRALNKVGPSFIRTEADEVYYGLHIILRFELETDLIGGRLSVADLPELWNERFEALFGITPPTSSQGVLQDVHWSSGSFGYFPSYSLGNLVAAQLYEKILVDQPSLPQDLALGDCSSLFGWLRTNVHQHGRKYSARQLVKNVTGKEISSDAFIAYLNAKFGCAAD
jgi:carboxypeptidase Taq